MRKYLVASLLGLSLSLAAQTNTAASQSQSNEKLIQMAQEDQLARTSALTQAERAKAFQADATRLAAVKEMIAQNQLATGLDYFNAALIMQHGQTSDDYLLAHTLAVIGISKGNRNCIWLSAATLDRYLFSMKQPQIYGTQSHRIDPAKPFTMEPYADQLVTDGLRKELDVPAEAVQKQRLDKLNQSLLAK